MRFSLARPLAVLSSLAAVLSPVAAEQLLKSTSLNTCQEDSGFTASLFNVVFYPSNNTASVNILAVSSVQGHVIFDVAISAYGYEFIRTTVNPCDANLAGLCPMTAGKIPLPFNLKVDPSAAKQIPGIAYTFPDLDAKVRVRINATDGEKAGQSLACVEADISNGKTVDLVGVKWATAIIAGLALASSAVVSGLGHSNAASHLAANAMSLFGYFQAQAMVGMSSVPLPPVVQSWTQDFQWSMGIIRVGFMQKIFTWYQRATGGTPSTLFDSLTTVSVQVEKRALLRRGLEAAAPALNMFKRAVAMMPRGAVEGANTLAKRGNIQTGSGSYIVYGIQRVAFRATIESTNLFMTGLTFFCIFVVLTVLGVAAFKGYCELAVKNKWMKSDTFLEFRNGWFTVLKGILFRLALIGFPQMTILCLWEFTQVDSAAEVVLAVFFFFGLLVTLGWAAFKVIRIARRSVAMHRNPAYILFSDPQALNKWGFLYVQFRASAYYFIVPFLGYLLIKGIFVACAQHNGTVQAIAFVLIEAAALIAASVLRPWMDKSTNSFNIAICVINFLNAIFLLIFSDVFNQPPLVTGVVGVVLWIANAIFALVLLIMLIVTTVIVFFRKNPDARYQFMADDRASFMKSQTGLTTTTELDALAATARGDKAGYKGGLDLDDDADSISSDSLRRRADPANHPLPPSTANSYRDPPRSPVDPSMPLFPADGRRPPQQPHQAQNPYNNGYGNNQMRSPSPYNGSASNLSSGYRSQNNASPAGFRSQNNASPWQRGAGYEH
ncbi:uncharacterized protein E0L32_000026 [Thyridium curvatum]|uniref:ML-like domain-containing protein n=1 Tax=Thyridium curvatum TaxID=1093900 RepID=A0A507B0D8_9PEZI|nr:uncharacterized protein E0L32_000026 [Thyridium curvatum]TPX15692.1 hypothetical protein E0L32_000026 [Thyridium curvatum]